MRVALFATCLVGLFRPAIGRAATRLLADSGCTVEMPTLTCCGQPAYNGGARALARDVARRSVAALDGFDYVVVPSGSCAGMIRRHYPLLLEGEPRAAALAARTYELTQFMADVLRITRVPGRFAGRAAYHDSCSSLRDLGVKVQPRKLLASVDGLELRELAAPDVCCGFGGAFCVKYPGVSAAMAADKLADIEAAGTDTVIAADLGCLLHLARRGRVRALHVAEVLANVVP